MAARRNKSGRFGLAQQPSRVGKLSELRRRGKRCFAAKSKIRLRCGSSMASSMTKSALARFWQQFERLRELVGTPHREGVNLDTDSRRCAFELFRQVRGSRIGQFQRTDTRERPGTACLRTPTVCR